MQPRYRSIFGGLLVLAAVHLPASPLHAQAADRHDYAPRSLSDASGCTTPTWPAMAIRFGEPPRVELALLLDLQGDVIETRILRSSGAKLLDSATATALKTCKFTPLQKNGANHPGWISVTYQWKLD